MLICRRHCCRHWKLSQHVKPLKMWDFYRIMPVNIKFHISCPYLRFSFFNSLVWYQSREKQLIFVSAITLSMYIYLVGNNTTFATGILFIIFSDICLKGKKKHLFSSPSLTHMFTLLSSLKWRSLSSLSDYCWRRVFMWGFRHLQFWEFLDVLQRKELDVHEGCGQLFTDSDRSMVSCGRH